MLKTILAVLFLVLSVSQANALSLQWDTVSLSADGTPLSGGNTVTGYRVFGCSSNSCTAANGVFIALVPADSPQLATKKFDITSLPKPQTYFVTAVNLSGESVPSNTARVTPADAPKNLIAIP